MKKKMMAAALLAGLIVGGIAQASADTTTITANGTFTPTLSATVSPNSLTFSPTNGAWDMKAIRVTNTGDVPFYPSLKLYNLNGLDNTTLIGGNEGNTSANVDNQKFRIITTRADVPMNTTTDRSKIVNVAVSSVNGGFGNAGGNNGMKGYSATDFTSGTIVYPTNSSDSFVNQTPTDAQLIRINNGEFVETGIGVGAGSAIASNHSFSFNVDVVLNN